MKITKLTGRFSGMGKFLTLWAGQAVSSLGTAMTNYALLVWVYQQRGTASSVALLSVCSFLPSVLFCFVAGTLADKWDKKTILLVSDAVAAAATALVFALFATQSLQIWHLYIINFTLSCMNAFQSPAAYVAITLITPKEHYVRAGGLHALSSSIVTILAPALGAALLSFAGIQAVFIADLITFSIGFFTLLLFIRLPELPAEEGPEEESFFRACLQGLTFLRGHRAILRIILFFTLINLPSFIGAGGMMSVMVLSRSGGNQNALGLVSSAIGAGTLVGSVLVTLARPAKSRTRVVFLSCALAFLFSDILVGVGRGTLFWMIAAFAGNLPLPFLNGNLTGIMRSKVPVKMQGRVFSTRDTLQFTTIPIGYFLGGVLIDRVFEPFMASPSPLRQLLSGLVGSGTGSGVAVLFLVSGLIGLGASLLALRNPLYRELDI